MKRLMRPWGRLKIRGTNTTAVLYLICSSFYFGVSLKWSGAEAYHNTGLLTFLKWVIIGGVVNFSFLTPVLSVRGFNRLVLILFMPLAMTVNLIVSSNPQNRLFYDLLIAGVVSLAVYLFFNEVYSYGKYNFPQRRS